VHCIVTGGGLATSGDRWISSRQRYLFPIRVLSALFRGKFIDALTRSYARGELDLGGACADLAGPDIFSRLMDTLYRKDWVVYAKRPFAGPEQVFKYLGRYTHRTGISNHRLVSFDEGAVCFITKDGKHAVVPPKEFIRRFLLHVLPDGYVKIRHYGLLASGNVRTKLAEARRHLHADDDREAPSNSNPTWQERFLALTGIDLEICPHCGGQMVAHPLEEHASHTAMAASSSAFVDTS
jgi:hypothetical protein